MSMERDFCCRTEVLIGQVGMERLACKHVLVAGLGGVGGHAAEAFARGGVGRMTIIDHDLVDQSNMNRQLLALQSTVGRPKVEVMRGRLLDINPNLQLDVRQSFIDVDNAADLIAETRPDYVADCIDSIACKAALIAACLEQGVSVMSCMGAGNRLDPTRIKITRLNQTHDDGLARGLRRKLKAMGVAPRLKVVFSDEKPRPVFTPNVDENAQEVLNPKTINGTISYMPALFGLTLAGAMIKQMLEE